VGGGGVFFGGGGGGGLGVSAGRLQWKGLRRAERVLKVGTINNRKRKKKGRARNFLQRAPG